jgi:UDP-N-acetyl-D-mannosaminuronate dehydrogenase
MKNIAIVGLGYVGFRWRCSSVVRRKVVASDNDSSKVYRLQADVHTSSLLHAENITEQLQSGRFKSTTDYSVIDAGRRGHHLCAHAAE